jgi:hypothetical protein
VAVVSAFVPSVDFDEVVASHTHGVARATKGVRGGGFKRHDYCQRDNEPWPCAAISLLMEREIREGRTTHRCPPGDSGYTPCCDRSPFELPGTDRMTLDKTVVTCTGPSATYSEKETA